MGDTAHGRVAFVSGQPQSPRIPMKSSDCKERLNGVAHGVVEDLLFWVTLPPS